MSRSNIVLLGLCFAFTGCATHRTIELDPPDQAALWEAALEIEGRRAALDLGATWVPQAIDVSLGPDSLRWRTRDGGPYAVAPSRVESITVRNRARGLLEGLAVGAGTAILAGAVAAICCKTPDYAWIPNWLAVGVAAGVVGIPLGALVGLVRGHPVIYEAR